MISELLPACIRAIETDGEPVAADPCIEELASLGRMAEGRLREFRLARHCARRALFQLGLPPRPIPVGHDRCPIWPHGVVGSITHCWDYRAAAVAFRARVAGVGIDAEVNELLPPSTLSVVVSPAEREAIGALPRIGVAWDRLVFSAKESAYKVWYPIMRSWLDFDGARIHIHPDPTGGHRGSLTVQLLASPLVVDDRLVDRLEGRYAVDSGRIVTAIAVNAIPSVDSTG